MKNTQKLAKDIYNTIIKKHGYTDPKEKGRYIVAHPSHEYTVKASEFSEAHVIAFLQICEAHNLSLGAWHDQKASAIVFDAVTSFDDIKEASLYALSSNQKAIYDIQTHTEIFDYIKYI